ncbi:MAG: phosphate butyryltransferase [Candidatus Glassbacteria bacterium]|nr:phosphate butyryltransferase [Candidatus Glassbacteria bacterium]
MQKIPLQDVRELKVRARELAGSRRPAVVVAGADDPVTLASVRDALAAGLVRAVLVGEKDRIEQLAGSGALEFDGSEVVDCSADEAIPRSLDLLRDRGFDLLMKGRVKTGDLLGAFLDHSRGLRTERILSHLGVFTAPGRPGLMIITDGGLNLAPDLEHKKDILLNAVEVAHRLGLETPRVAVLAHVEKSPHHDLPMIRHAEELTRLNREGLLAGCLVEGPLAFDNAVSEAAAGRKGISGPVAGRADILLANEIGMGNVIYKAVQSWLDGVIAGIVVGGKVPVITPSRADSEESKLAAIALGVILSSPADGGYTT